MSFFGNPLGLSVRHCGTVVRINVCQGDRIVGVEITPDKWLDDAIVVAALAVLNTRPLGSYGPVTLEQVRALA